MPADSPKVFLPPAGKSPLQNLAVLIVAVIVVSLAFFWYFYGERTPAVRIATASSAPAFVQPAEPPAKVVKDIPIPPPPVPVVIPEKVEGLETKPGAPVDLLKLIDPARDVVVGNWTRKGDVLHSDATPFARLQVPYQVPEEYDVTMVFTRAGGNDEVAIVLKKNSAYQFRWVMGGWQNEITGFDMIHGRWPRENPSGKVIKSGVLTNDIEYTTLVQVRNDGVRAYLQNELISEHKTDFSDMRLWNLFSMPDSRALGIISQNGALIIHTFTLTPVTGNGGLIKDARLQPNRYQAQKSNDRF